MADATRPTPALDAVAWYHTIELAPGVVTPGYYDCRGTSALVPWPDLAGKRCLDVGTFDGYWAFEMERRGAGSVTALDVDDPAELDWPADAREEGPRTLRRVRSIRGHGFAVAREALGSAVERMNLNVYDLDPSAAGTFDVVFLGAILLHLRDPVRALEAVRGVAVGSVLVVEAVDPALQLLAAGVPAARFGGLGADMQWWTPNVAGLRRLLRSAGLETVRATRPFVLPWGASPWAPRPSLSGRLRNLLVTGTPRPGAVQVALEARASRSPRG